MKRIILTLLFLIITVPAFATQWRGGTGENTILGSSNASDIDFNSYNSIVKPLDNLLATYCNEYLVYGSSTTIKVSSGSVVVSNSGGTIRLFLQDSATTTLTSANLDTGSILASTTYYVYATAASSSATSSTYYISASNTAPTGQTYYFQIGSFTTDSSSQFGTIVNNYGSTSYVGALQSKTIGVTYQALTDGEVTGYALVSGADGYMQGITDSKSAPTTVVTAAEGVTNSVNLGITFSVAKGDYYKVTQTGGLSSVAIYFRAKSK